MFHIFCAGHWASSTGTMVAMWVGNQEFTEATLARIGDTVLAEPQLSRRQLSRRLCQWLDWRDARGQPKEMSARKALLKLQRAGQVSLPPARRQIRRQGPPPAAPPLPALRLSGSVEQLQQVRLLAVGGPRSSSSRLWKALLAAEHYLGYTPLAGAQLRYLIESEHGCLGAIGFSAAAWHLQPRDAWIGWSPTARQANLPLVINQSRFLIRPGVTVKNLASRVLGLAARQLPADWRQRYWYEPLLLESFVEQGRFVGTCYRAANWVAVGTTQGRGRQDRAHRRALPRKEIFLYPLDADFRSKLCREPAPGRLPPAPPPPPPPPPADWAEQEFGGAPLGDERLVKRLHLLARDLYAQPQAQLPQACGSRAKLKAAYRFFDHPHVNLPAILQPHYQSTTTRLRPHPVVLAVQDTTTLNYSTHPATTALGLIGSSPTGPIGLLVHDTMAFSPQGTPLGLLDVQCWARDPQQFGKKQRRAALPVEAKESVKWLRSFQAAAAAQQQCPATLVVSVGDREADVYELFVLGQQDPAGPKLLVRAQQDRLLEQGQAHLWESITQQPLAGVVSLQVPRRQNRCARVAELAVRFAQVSLRPPRRKQGLGVVRLWAVLARERNAPAGVEPLEWLLLSSVAVENFPQALERLQWYSVRWQIEVYHRTLKSGCRIETRQLGSADRLESCLAIDLVVAWRILHLTKLGRETPEVACTVFFEEQQWRALVAFVRREAKPAATPPSLREAIRMVASLGGFLGRKSDGEPGTQTLWLGLQKLDTIFEAWQIFTQPLPPLHSLPPDTYG